MHPLPWAFTGGAICVLLALAYGSELLMQRNLLWGVLVFCAAAVIAAVTWRWQRPGGHDAPRRLHLRGDGIISMFAGNGRVWRAKLQPHSLRLGSHWLLVLVTEDGRRHRLLLGPGNLQPVELAALGRWLRRPPADPFGLR